MLRVYKAMEDVTRDVLVGMNHLGEVMKTKVLESMNYLVRVMGIRCKNALTSLRTVMV